MIIQSLMFYVLGFLCAIILALLVLPAIWRRAVRLTKKRIAAATPVTLSEFRAEKDQLRAKNALDLRKLELQLEDLRKKRASQLRELTQLRQAQELAVHESENSETVAEELEDRNQELKDQVRQYEVELTNVSQKLRHRERDLANKIEELDQARATANIAASAVVQNFDEDINEAELEGDAKKLAKSLTAERKRNAFLEEQLRASMARVQELKARSRTNPDKSLSENIPSLLDDAEAHIAIANERFSALTSKEELQNSDTVFVEETKSPVALAQEIQVDDELEDVGSRILSLEEDILARFAQETGDIDDLRERMENIAVDVSHIVYAEDAKSSDSASESLFDRVRKYANDGLDEADLVEKDESDMIGRVADRMDALKKIASN